VPAQKETLMPRRSAEEALSEDIVRALAEGLPPVELADERRASLRGRVLDRAVRAAPPDTETIRGEDLPWRQAWPGVWVKVLKRDAEADFQITLMRFDAGGRIPAHSHRRSEECYVLEGEVMVGAHSVKAGDFHIARAGGQHPDLTSIGGALVILRSELY
jgi:anti-sigma factor ChrR (cupin superfamily)